MKEWNKFRRLPLLCIATHMPFAHTSVKNRYTIFLMPVPSKKVSTYGNIAKQRAGFVGIPDSDPVQVMGIRIGSCNEEFPCDNIAE